MGLVKLVERKGMASTGGCQLGGIPGWGKGVGGLAGFVHINQQHPTTEK